MVEELYTKVPTVVDLKRIAEKQIQAYPNEILEVFIALGVDDIEKILDILKKRHKPGYREPEGINIRIKVDQSHTGTPELFLFPDLEEKTLIWG